MTPYEKSFLAAEDGKEYLFVTSSENQIFLITAIVIGMVCLLAKKRPQNIDLLDNRITILNKDK